MTGRLSHADADGECSFLPFFQHRTILILRTPGHCDAGIDIFADGVFQKSFRCKDDRFARGKLFVDGKAGVRYIVPVTYADTSALEKDFSFRPNTSLREGLRRFALWYKEFYLDRQML